MNSNSINAKTAQLIYKIQFILSLHRPTFFLWTPWICLLGSGGVQHNKAGVSTGIEGNNEVKILLVEAKANRKLTW